MQSEIIMARIKNSDIEALEQIMDEYASYLFTVAKNMSSPVLQAIIVSFNDTAFLDAEGMI